MTDEKLYPKPRWNEFIDLFTRMPRQLDVLIKLLVEIRDSMYRVVGVQPPPTPAPAPTPAPVVPSAIVSLDPYLEPVGDPVVYELSSDRDTRHVVGVDTYVTYILVEEGEAWFNTRDTTLAPTNFPLKQGILWRITLPPNKELHFRARTPTARIYVYEFRRVI